MTIEEFNQIHALLERIATAFEQQNKMNAASIATQEQWHQEDIGPRIVAIHERDAERNEEWRQEQRRLFVAQIKEYDKVLQQAHEEYLKHLTQQKYALSETIDTLCERVGVEKPDWDSTERMV